MSKGSFRPSKQIEGTGLAFDGTVIKARTGKFDYNGQVEQPQVGVWLTFRNDDLPEAEPVKEFYSAGKAAIITPTENEFGFASARPDKEYEGVNKNSVAGLLFRTFVEVGFPEAEMHVNGDENDLRFLEGARFHIELKDRLTQGGDKKASKFPTKYLGRDGAAKTAAAPGAVATAVATADYAAQAAALITEVLAEAEGNSIPKAKLSPAVLKKVGTDPATRNGVVKLVVNDAYLKGLGSQGIKFDGKTLSL